MSLLMDALRRAEQVKQQGLTEQGVEASPGNATAQKPAAAAPSARLVSGGDAEARTPANEVRAAEGEGSALTLSMDDVTPVTTDAATARRATDSRDPSPGSVPPGPAAASPMSSAQMASQLQARRMFAAKAWQSRRRRLGYIVGGGIALLFVVLGFVYFEVVVSTGRFPAPQVAVPLTVQDTLQSVPAAEDATPEVAAVVPAPAVALPQAVVDTGKTGTSATQQQRKQVTSTKPDVTRAPVASVQNPQPSSPLVIVHNQAEDPIQVLLAQAFDDYQAGNDQRAETGYRAVLDHDPNNRDALLGLAALAQRSGRVEEARYYYRRLLELNPMDSTSIAALIGLEHGSDPLQDESQIKLLLKQEPAAAHLHFALGMLYVAQVRWAEAQQAFFNAYYHDSVNADYAFNLAVCLDRLGQPAAALGYYRRALELVRGRTVSFKEAEVAQRIDTLVTVAARAGAP